MGELLQVWDGKQTLGYSHNSRLGAVFGCLIEALRVLDGFLCVLKAAFRGCEVGCGGKGGCCELHHQTMAPQDLEYRMEAVEHLSSSHSIL